MKPSQVQEDQKAYWEAEKSGRRRPDHPVVAATFEPLAAQLAALVAEPRQAHVLDVGCGNGFLTVALEKRFGSVACLDASPEMLRINPCKNQHLSSATKLPFGDASYDLVVASHLLHHLVPEDRLKTLREMARVSRGAVVSFEPNRNNPLMFLLGLLKKEERMLLGFSRSYMERLLRESGLQKVTAHVEGWMVPNRAPCWWIPVARFLGRTPMRAWGVDVCSVGWRPERELPPTNAPL